MCLTALLRHCATPPLAFPKRVAFGATLRRGCAASRLHVQPTVLFPLFRQDDNIHRVPVTLLTITKVSPMRVLILGASLRDRAALPSPLRGLVCLNLPDLDLRAVIPRPSVRCAHSALRLARRFASLTAACLNAAAVRCFRSAVRPPSCPPRAGAARRAPRRHCLAGVRIRDRRLARSRAEPRPLSRRRGSPPIPIPEPFPPTFGTLDWVFSTPFGGSALTPDASPMPGAPCLRSNAQGCAELRQSMMDSAESWSCRAGKSSVNLTAPLSHFDCEDKLLIF